MSSENSLDPQLIEQTKLQIRTLVNEIGQLSKSDVAPEEFYAEFLPRVVSALAASGGAIWTVEDQGRLALGYQINLQETKLREKEEDQIRHGRLLQKVLTSGDEMLVPPRSGAGDDQEAANPTDFLLVLGALKTELEIVGIVEVFQRPEAGPNTQKGYLRFLKQMCDLAGDFFKSRQLRHFGDRQVLWSQLEEFTRVIHTSLDPRDAAYTIANEGRRLIECDRVSVAIRKGKKCLIEAVSGQDLFDKRSNTVRLLGQLATAVVTSGEPVWYTGDTSNMAPQVEDAVQEYVDESHSKAVAVLPLSPPQPELEEEDDLDKREQPVPPFGALIVEQIEDSRVPQRMLQRVDVVSKHSATALGNALEHNKLFLMPVWRALGKARWVLKARTLPKTIGITAAIVAVLLALVLVSWPFKAHSDGTLEPVVKREVFAGVDGTVVEVLVKHRDWVFGEQIVGKNTSSDEQEVLGTITSDRGYRQRQAIASGQPDTGEIPNDLLTVPAGNGLFVANQVRPGDTVRTRFAGDQGGEETYTEFVVHEVLDENTIRLVTGPEKTVANPQRIEVWRMPTLVRLRNTELTEAILATNGRLAAVREKILGVNRLITQGSGAVDRSQLTKWQSDLLEYEEEKITLEKQQKLNLVKRRELEVRAPIDGQVVTWNVDKVLPPQRPVQKGVALMRLADSSGEWQLELHMPEKRMGHIERARQAIKKKDPNDDLEVQFVLATDPDKRFTGKVKEIDTLAEVRGEEGNTVLIKVAFDKQALPNAGALLRPGASVSAKVACGKRSIGYVLFGDAIAWFQKNILFRF